MKSSEFAMKFNIFMSSLHYAFVLHVARFETLRKFEKYGNERKYATQHLRLLFFNILQYNNALLDNTKSED